MSNPYGAPSAPQRKSRSPLYIALGCGCALLAVIVLVVGGIGAYLLLQEPTEEPTEDPSTTATEDPSEDPTEDPTDEPTDDPTDEPTSNDSISMKASSASTGSTLTKADGEELETENGKFVGVSVAIDNDASGAIGLGTDSFRFYDTDGNGYDLRYATFTTDGPELPAGESATANLYADIPADVEIAQISYSDPSVAGGQEVTFPVG